MSAAAEAGTRLRVVLADFPVALWSASDQWFEEVRRELALAGLSGDADSSRLAASVTELLVRYRLALGGDSEGATAILWDAHERGLERIDVEYALSPDIAATAPRVRSVIDDLDRRCREGELLTLPARVEATRLMAWLPAEVLGRYQGAPPHAWPGPWSLAA